MRTDFATLCFIVVDGRALLIRKKRGLGAGKVNAPGGKLEPGESAQAAAVRETQEEVGVTPLGLRECGVLHFRFTYGYRLECVVFIAEGLVGTPMETAEAAPFWVKLEEIPYEEMWQDDRHWLPLVLAGHTVEVTCDFDGDRMLSLELKVDGEK